MRRSAASLLAACALTAVPAAAGELSYAGSMRSGLWSSDRRLDDATGVAAQSLWLNGYYQGSEGIRLVFDGHAWAELHPGDSDKDVAVRDAYARLENGPAELRLGWQSFAWGRADRINPTDVLGRRDHTLLVSGSDEQRLGLPAAALGWEVAPETRLSGIVQLFRPSRLPTTTIDRTLPETADRDDRVEWAMRLDRVGSGFDWSASVVRGYDKQRWMVLLPQAGGAFAAARDYPRQTVFGSDAATTLGEYGVRGELAYTRVDDGQPPEWGGKSSNLFSVVGADRNLGEGGDDNLNVQYLFRWNPDYAGPDRAAAGMARDRLSAFAVANNQLAIFQQAVSLRYAHQPFDGALTWEVMAVIDLADASLTVQPRLNWRLTDAVTMKTGIDLYRGDGAASYFGSLRRDSLAFTELQFVF